MQPTQDNDNYPVFEANQVLTNAHLNQVFNYLEEQGRLTRANLIGIGIVCGLEIKPDNLGSPTAISLSKGCGITSEGYLIVEPNDLALVAYRAYQPPDEIAYPTFKASYSLWEMFPAGVPNTLLFEDAPGFLNDKAVILFLELNKSELRNCSPNNCDDKGARVTVKVRRLLISKPHLLDLLAGEGLAAELNPLQREAMLAAQLDLPDLRMPRFDVPNTSPITANDILKAFLELFGDHNLAASIGDVFSKAYEAFKPILKETFPNDPFAGFSNQFGFLDGTPASTAQVRFLQYYYDFFTDLIAAYDEFRAVGLELLCACCPSGQLFPRHLALGLVVPDANAARYRQRFLPSAATSDCEQRTQQAVFLFRRIVAMVDTFTQTPSLPPPTESAADPQIRITPSKLGAQPLSEKAIPYYYRQTATPPLHQLWNPKLSRHHKANQNLGYRADEYQPAAPNFVVNPLAYDLEPYNFLRIEGHLGKPYQRTLHTLLTQKIRFRLPIDIIALRVGAFDANAPVDFDGETCRFQDLQTLYASLRGQSLCGIVNALTYFYNLYYPEHDTHEPPAKSQFAVINQYAPEFLVQPATLGRAFEDYITAQQGNVPDIDASMLAGLIAGFTPNDTLIYYSFFYLIKLSGELPANFSDLNFTDLAIRHQNLEIVVKAIEQRREQGIFNLEGTGEELNWEETDDRLEAILYDCQPEAFLPLRSEYLRRLGELKKTQFLGNFLADHPGIQHKAGVPMGGTFIIVYHQEPFPEAGDGETSNIKAVKNPLAAKIILPQHLNKDNFDTFLYPYMVYTPSVFSQLIDVPEVKVAPEIAVKPGTPIITTAPINTTAPGNPIFEKGTVVKAETNLNTAALAQDTTLSKTKFSVLTAKSTARSTPLIAKDPSTAAATMSVNPSFINAATDKSATGVSQTTGSAASAANQNPLASQLLAGAVKTNVGTNQLFADALNRLQIKKDLLEDNDLKIVLEGIASKIPADADKIPGIASLSDTDKIIAQTVEGFTDGTIIADFYLPYLVCSNCTSVQFVLPPPPLPCDLPDKGHSRRCAYRLWIQPPIDGQAYEDYQQTSAVKVQFNGKDLLVDEDEQLVQISANTLNMDFTAALTATIWRLNQAINAKISEMFGDIGQDRLQISFDPSTSDPFAILWIEHFVKDTFSIVFELNFTQSDSTQVFTIRYGNDAVDEGQIYDGVIFVNQKMDNKEIRVPAFDCGLRNQCSGSGYKKACTGMVLIPTLDSKNAGQNSYIFTVTNDMPKTGVAAWVWDFTSITDQPFYEGESVLVDWQPGGYIKLTAISDNGCFSFAVENRT